MFCVTWKNYFFLHTKQRIWTDTHCQRKPCIKVYSWKRKTSQLFILSDRYIQIFIWTHSIVNYSDKNLNSVTDWQANFFYLCMIFVTEEHFSKFFFPGNQFFHTKISMFTMETKLDSIELVLDYYKKIKYFCSKIPSHTGLSSVMWNHVLLLKSNGKGRTCTLFLLLFCFFAMVYVISARVFRWSLNFLRTFRSIHIVWVWTANHMYHMIALLNFLQRFFLIFHRNILLIYTENS